MLARKKNFQKRRTIATPMMPIPRNATLVCPGVATACGGDEEAAAAAAAATEGEEELLVVVVDPLETSTMPRSSLSFCGLGARNDGLLSIEREECVVPEAWQRVGEERTRGDVEGGPVARSEQVDLLLPHLEAAARGEAGAERSMVFSSASSSSSTGGGLLARGMDIRDVFRCLAPFLSLSARETRW